MTSVGRHAVGQTNGGRRAVPVPPSAGARVQVVVDVAVRDDDVRRVRHDRGPGERERSACGAGERARAVLRENRRRGRRAGPGRAARSARRRPRTAAAGQLQAGQVRSGQRGQEPGATGRHHRRDRPFRARHDRQQRRVPVAAELPGVRQVRVHVRQQRRVSRRPGRPAAARRRPDIVGRVRLLPRRARRLLRHVLRGKRGRARPEPGERRATVHARGRGGVRSRQAVRRHRQGRRKLRPPERSQRRVQRHRPRDRRVLSRATHDLPHHVVPLSRRDETGNGVHGRTGRLSRGRGNSHV